MRRHSSATTFLWRSLLVLVLGLVLRREHRLYLARGQELGVTRRVRHAHALAQHVDLDDAALAARGDHALAELGQALAQLGVRGLLVDEAALEASALAGDFGR